MPIQRPSRLPLPLSSSVNVPPDSPVLISARPQTAKFYPERLLIKEAHHWQIMTIRVANHAGVLAQKLPGALFTNTAPGRFPNCGEIEIPPGGDLSVEVKYTGPEKAGIPFEACVFGSDDLPRVTPSARRREEKITTARCELALKQSVQLFTNPMRRDAWPCRLVIKDASDWIVNDIHIGEVSIFAQSGDVPGSMFSKNAESAVCLGRLVAGDTFSVVATYVGGAASAEFIYDLYGTLDETEASNLPIGTILPMSSGINCLASGQWMQITGRCQPPGIRHRGIRNNQGFLAERLVVEDAADWIFNDIKVGRVSQFAQAGEVPGLAFGPETLRNAVSFDVARAGIDVSIVGTRVGGREAPLSCGILGCVVDLTGGSPSPQSGQILTVRDFYKRNT